MKKVNGMLILDRGSYDRRCEVINEKQLYAGVAKDEAREKRQFYEMLNDANVYANTADLNSLADEYDLIVASGRTDDMHDDRFQVLDDWGFSQGAEIRDVIRGWLQ
jgi:hypothetical protein